METIPYHTHNGTDSPKVKLADSLPVTSTVPDWPAREGTAVLYFSGTTYRIYFMVNKTWKNVALS